MLLECDKVTKMLLQNGYPFKIVQNIIRKAIHRSQNPYAKLCPNQQESKKHCVFLKLQFIDRISMQIQNEIRDFVACVIVYDMKLIMSHRIFTIG